MLATLLKIFRGKPAPEEPEPIAVRMKFRYKGPFIVGEMPDTPVAEREHVAEPAPATVGPKRKSWEEPPPTSWRDLILQKPLFHFSPPRPGLKPPYKASGWKGYGEYLESDHWRRLRQRVFERDGYACVECGERNGGLNAHHKFYRQRLEDSLDDDLETLCLDCHRLKHALAETEEKPAR